MPNMMEYTKAAKLLSRYGIRSAECAYLPTREAAVKFASSRGPIAIKAITSRALHKTKSGIMELNLSAAAQVSGAYARISRRARRFRPYRMLGQRMVKGGLEIIVGGNTDSQFGKLIMIGLGGIYVETFRDVALRVCPISRTDAGLMIDQLRSGNVIAPDVKSHRMLEDLLLSASSMFYENDMKEMDLNPVILHDGTYDAVDIRILE